MTRLMKRQGDVLLVPVEAIPDGATQADRDEASRIVLAVGEKSGHAHAIRDSNVTAFKMETAEGDASNRALADYILVGGSGAKLAHEYIDARKADHDPIELEPGAYRVVQQRNYVGQPKPGIAAPAPREDTRTSARAFD